MKIGILKQVSFTFLNKLDNFPYHKARKLESNPYNIEVKKI